MLQTIKQLLQNFLGSEKAIAALVVLIGATIFTITGKMSVADWKDMSLYVLGIYTAGKTVQGAAAVIADSRVKLHNGVNQQLAVNDQKADEASQKKF